MEIRRDNFEIVVRGYKVYILLVSIFRLFTMPFWVRSNQRKKKQRVCK